MIEYDLPFDKKCSTCNGYGYLMYDQRTNIRGIKYIRKDCHECKGTGKVPIGPELELEND